MPRSRDGADRSERLERARVAIERAESLDELKQIRDQAEAARHYVKAAKMGKGMADRCAEIRLRAERRAGEMLRDRDPHPPGPTNQDRSHDETYPPKLDDLGVSKNQSHRWQKLAAVPEESFETYLQAVQDDDKSEITAVGLAQFSARQNKRHTAGAATQETR